MRGVGILFAAVATAGLVIAQPQPQPKPYPLMDWNRIPMAKGRFQDREYLRWAVIDQIVADQKKAIPILISQLTDAREMKTPLFSFWPPVQVGEFAHFILMDLFTNDTWEESTMPRIFADLRCHPDIAAFQCWPQQRARHSMKELQGRWQKFWLANQAKISWDAKCRCFRTAGYKETPPPRGRQ